MSAGSPIGTRLEYPGFEDLVDEAICRIQHGVREPVVRYYLNRASAMAQVYILEQMVGFLMAEGVSKAVTKRILKRSEITRNQHSISKKEDSLVTDEATSQGPKYQSPRRRRTG